MRKAIQALAGLTGTAAAAGPNSAGKWVTGYYGGYFWDNAMTRHRNTST